MGRERWIDKRTRALAFYTVGRQAKASIPGLGSVR